MDSNRAASYNVRDNLTNKIVANFNTHNEATDYCFEVEPRAINNGCWQYTIEPVRLCDR